MTDTLHRDDMTDILPGFQQMLRALAEPDGLLKCSSSRIPEGVADMEAKGLIKPVHISTMQITYAITDKGRTYAEQLG